MRRRGFAMAVAEASPGRLFREARRASPQRQNNGARACDGAGLPWLSASKIPPLCIARELVSRSPSGHPPAPKRRKRARGRLSQKLWPSRGKLFREARRASPQRQNNGARACDGADLPWLSRKLCSENCFGKPDRPAPSAQINGARACDGAGLPWLSASKIPPLCIARKLVSGSPSGHPPAPKRRKRARGRLSQKLWPSPGKLFREARWGSPQRQNNGARACDGADLPWLSRKLRPSPGKLFREARRASSQRQNYGSGRERRAPSEAVAEASAVAQKVFLRSPTGLTPASKRRERAFGQPDGPDPSPNPRRFFASQKMARDTPGPGFCEP